jgi:hypothetical protein
MYINRNQTGKLQIVVWMGGGSIIDMKQIDACERLQQW